MQTILVVVDNFRIYWKFLSLQTIFENCERFSSLQTITLTIFWIDLRIVFSKLLTIFELNYWRISSCCIRFSFRRNYDNDNKYLQNYFNESLFNSSSCRIRFSFRWNHDNDQYLFAKLFWRKFISFTSRRIFSMFSIFFLKRFSTNRVQRFNRHSSTKFSIDRVNDNSIVSN